MVLALAGYYEGLMTKSFAGLSVVEFFERFPNENACLQHIFDVKWGNHTPCPGCGELGKWFRIGETKKYQHRCRQQFSLLKGTPFYRSNLSLMAWFYAMLLFANSSTGMRSSFIRKQLGIGVKSAHRMCNSIRSHMAMIEKPRLLGGPGRFVHVDEMHVKYIAGDGDPSQIVLGMACDGEVRCGIIPDRSKKSILPAIQRMVRPGSVIVSDAHASYRAIQSLGYLHVVINHSIAFHNFEGVTNNPIENVWAVLNPTMRNYQQAADHNFWRFLAEIQFRYNRRFCTHSPFWDLVCTFGDEGAHDGERWHGYFNWPLDTNLNGLSELNLVANASTDMKAPRTGSGIR